MEQPPSIDIVDEGLVIMRQIALGNRAALGQLYDQFARPLYSIAYNLLANIVEAEGAVQDVFVCVWKNASKFEDSRVKILTLLAVLLRNKCKHRLRRLSENQPIVAENAESSDKRHCYPNPNVDYNLDKEGIEHRPLSGFRIVGNMKLSGQNLTPFHQLNIGTPDRA